jgi:hypothetical protein
MTPEREAEVARLHAEFVEAVRMAGEVGQIEGWDSQAFLEADLRAGEIRRRLLVAAGHPTDRHWMS